MNKHATLLLATALIALLLGGCEKREHPDTFTAKEAEACLTPEDREAIDKACDKVRAYDAAKKANAMTKELEQGLTDAIEDLRSLCGRINNEGDSPVIRRRGAAVNWVLVAATYNRFNGTCACQVLFAAMKGHLEAQQLKENPPRGLTTYLLQPGDPRRIDEEYEDDGPGFSSLQQ